MADPNAETKVPGLVPGTSLRPADLLTTAAGSGRIAADISIVSPDAQLAGSDCTATRYASKVERYSPHLQTLLDQGITYKPLVWSCYGRPHPVAKRFMHDVAMRIARRRGHRDAACIAAQMSADVAVEIWRRNARQLRACLPDAGDEHGACDRPPDVIAIQALAAGPPPDAARARAARGGA